MTVGSIVIQGTRAPAVQLDLSGMPGTIALDPSSAGQRILFHVQPSYPGQLERCATLALTGSGRTLRVPLQANAPAATYFVDTPGLRGVLGGSSLGIQVCERITWLSRPQREALIALVNDAASASTNAPPPADAASASAGADQVRAILDSHREVLLACTGRDVVGIRASWDAAGALSVSLQPPLAGGPEEQCVRSQLSGAHIDGAAAGQAVHVLSR